MTVEFTNREISSCIYSLTYMQKKLRADSNRSFAFNGFSSAYERINANYYKVASLKKFFKKALKEQTLTLELNDEQLLVLQQTMNDFETAVKTFGRPNKKDWIAFELNKQIVNKVGLAKTYPSMLF